MKFTKKDTAVLKGIAICIMIFHHCYCSRDRFEGFDMDFAPLSQDTVVNIALTMKICVCFFAFISGYGLWLSYAKNREKYEQTKESSGRWVWKRYLKSFSGYWFVFLISAIVIQCLDQRVYTTFFKGQTVGEGIFGFLLNALGLQALFDSPTLCVSWWYMGLAACIIILCPLLYAVAEKVGIGTMFCLVAALPLMLQLKCSDSVHPLQFLLIAVFGMTMAELSLRKKADFLKLGAERMRMVRIGIFLLCLLCLYLFYKEYYVLDAEKYWLVKWGILPIIPIYFSLRYLVRIPGLRTLMGFLGKHSMNIYFVHTFLRGYYLKDFLYSLHIAWLVPVVLLLLSLVISVVIEKIKKWIHYDRLIDWMCEWKIRKEEASES